jgi:NAD(P)-dependent dehydrogenase (short-subunit alcohol dehydrogenase family)
MKNIIITGAGGNLGQMVVAEFLKGDYHLNLCVTKELPNSERQTMYMPDLTDGTAVQQMVDSILEAKGKIDGVVHLVGAYMPGNLDETNGADIDKMVNINFKTGFNLMKALLPHFAKMQAGKLVFTGAKAAMDPAMASANVAYALSKQMLPQLAYLINETDKTGNISAHVLLPGTLDTELNRKLMPDADFSKWTSTQQLAGTMRQVMEGQEKRVLVEC